MTDDQNIGAWIRRQMLRRGWTAAELARRMGVGSGRISEWIGGKRIPSSASCIRLADVFDADPDVVLTIAGHRVATEPLSPDDPHARVIALVKRVRLTPDRLAGLEGTLLSWIEFDRRDQLDETPNWT